MGDGEGGNKAPWPHEISNSHSGSDHGAGTTSLRPALGRWGEHCGRVPIVHPGLFPPQIPE